MKIERTLILAGHFFPERVNLVVGGLIPNQVSDEFVSDSSRDPIVHVELKD